MRENFKSKLLKFTGYVIHYKRLSGSNCGRIFDKKDVRGGHLFENK